MHYVGPSIPSLQQALNFLHYPPTSHRDLRLLSSCKDLNSLLQIHGRIIVSGLKQDNFPSTHLINSYSLFQICDFARSVFNSAPNPIIILWNSMIRAYTRSKLYKEALNMYHYMLEKGLEPDKYTFTFVLKACTGASNLQMGVLFHNEIARKGLECDVFIGTGLIDMYCKMGNLRCAYQMPEKDVVAWHAMIAGLSQNLNLDPREALGFFRSMQMDGVEPNSGCEGRMMFHGGQ